MSAVYHGASMHRSGANPSEAPRKSRIGWIVVAVLGGLMVVAGGGYVLFGLMVGSTVDLEPGDASRVITAADFRDHYALGDELTIVESRETLTRTEYIDGSYDVDYEYEAPDGLFYLSCALSHSRTADDARNYYTGATLSLDIAFRTFGDGVEAEDADAFPALGDQQKAGWLSFEGQRTGAYVVVQNDEDVLTFIMSGYELDETSVQELLAPIIDAQ